MEFAQRLLSTRRGSTLLGISAALIAGILLLVYLNQYRDSVKQAGQPVTVLVAKSLIQKGTSGDVMRSSGLVQTTTVPKDQLRQGAFTDASILTDKVAASEIAPGQQRTAALFAPAINSVSTKLTRNLRAISVPIDSAHGLVGQVQTGDHVDVLAGFSAPDGRGPVIKEIVHNALVLRGPAGSGGGLTSGGSNIVLRATAFEVAQFAWASDNGRIWIILRPSANATSPKAQVVDVKTLYNNSK